MQVELNSAVMLLAQQASLESEDMFLYISWKRELHLHHLPID